MMYAWEREMKLWIMSDDVCVREREREREKLEYVWQ